MVESEFRVCCWYISDISPAAYGKPRRGILVEIKKRRTGRQLRQAPQLLAAYFCALTTGPISVNGCPFRKFDPAWIRIVRQNHRILESDDCDPARARNVRRRPVQVAELA